MRGSGENPFATVNKTQGVRFSLRFLLLLNVVFTCTAAGLAFVARVPSVSEEINAWLGRANSTPAENDRASQVIFVFAVYAMPLVMAILVWLFSLAIQWLQRFMPQTPTDSFE
jgi:hypothetical protein